MAAVIVAVMLAVAAWLLLRSGGDDPSLGGNLVDGRALASCLQAASNRHADWRVKEVSMQRPISPSTPTSAHIVMKGYGDLTVYPNEAAADELDSRVSFDGENYAGEPPKAEHYGNVLEASYEGEKPTPSAGRAVKGCIEEAATVKPTTDKGAFQDCGNVGTTERLSVRGESCDAARAYLRQRRGFVDRLRECQEDGGKFVCLSEYLCCMLSSQYMGSRDVELVFDW